MGFNGAKGREEGAVDCSGVENEDTYDLLDQGDVFLVEFGSGVGGSCELGCCSVLGCCPLVGGVLWFGWRGVLEALECFFDVSGHGDVYGAVDVIPCEVEATEGAAGPVGGNGVFGLEGRLEVLCMLFAYVFDAEVVDYKAEADGSSYMREEAWDGFGLVVSMCGEMWDEVVIGDLACLWESVHAFIDFDEDKSALIDKFIEVVDIDDFLGGGGDVDAHVFGVWQVVVEVVVFDVHGHEEGIVGADDTVEENFGSDHASSFGADIIWVIDKVASDSVSDAVWIFFLWAVGDDNSHVGGFEVFGYVGVFDEAHGVGALCSFVAIEEATKFFAVAFYPEVALRAAGKFFVFRQFVGIGVEGYVRLVGVSVGGEVVE